MILDLSGLSMSHLSATFTGLLKTYIGKFSNLYPESLYKLFVINAPFIFSGAWGAISLFVHPVTRAKIHIISNPRYALEELGKLGAKLEHSFAEVRGGAAAGGLTAGPSSARALPQAARLSTSRPCSDGCPFHPSLGPPPPGSVSTALRRPTSRRLRSARSWESCKTRPRRSTRQVRSGQGSSPPRSAFLSLPAD